MNKKNNFNLNIICNQKKKIKILFESEKIEFNLYIICNQKKK